MATHQQGNAQGFVDRQRANQAKSAHKGSGSVATPANYDSQDSLDARLLAIGYTQKTIDSMTHNDKVYAVRRNDDPNSI